MLGMVEHSQNGPGQGSTLRPTIARRDTEAILSYYQSDLAGRSYEPEQAYYGGPGNLVRSSSTSSSSSTYSHESLSPEREVRAEGDVYSHRLAAAPRKRRPSTNLKAADNRHVAVVPLDTPPPLSPGQDNSSPSPLASSDALLSKPRGGTDRQSLAFISRRNTRSTSTQPIPPWSAPIGGSMLSAGVASGSSTPPLANHQRSTSEAEHPSGTKGVHRKTSSRDIGIVGTRRGDSGPAPRLEPTPPSALAPPIFQTPQSRSPSPAALQYAPVPPHEDAVPSSVHSHVNIMPMIGEKAPLVDKLTTSPTSILPGASTPPARTTEHSVSASNPSSSPQSSAFSVAQPSSYLFYEPGIHSTAGPLPPPPRAMFDIDFKTPPPPRPPRLRSPSPVHPRGRDAIPTPSSVSVLLSAKSSTRSLKSQEPEVMHQRSPSTTGHSPETAPNTQMTTVGTTMHVREGAFPPSTILVTPPIPHTTTDPEERVVDTSLDDPPLASSLPNEDIAHGPDVDRRLGTELRRESSWNSLGAKLPGDARESLDNGSQISSEMESVSPPQLHSSTLSLSVKEPPQKTKGTLTSLKRFSSLPRTPSVADSLPNSSVSSHTPSPLVVPTIHRPRKRSLWPDAMWYKDVLAGKTALERAIGYAQKINELAMYDCGLSDWILQTKAKANSRGNSSSSPAYGQLSGSVRPVSFQPRHVSNGSIASQATFPRRPDAYVATDLSPRPTDTLPPHYVPPPALPYPSLAQTAPVVSNHRLSTVMSPASVRSMPFSASKPGGFFSSIGRNYSLKKEKERSGALPPKVLTKSPPSNLHPSPRPIQIVSSPSVPGGPRAAPGRLQRSQTLMLSPPDTPHTSKARRRSNTLKRPSLFGRAGTTTDVEVDDPELTRQVDKLSDLLPHADRDVLAGYLRRAGQDILAIGQYLEDEKNGTIQRI